MSASISEQNFQYVGILNGVMYRIDPSTGRSVEPMFGTQPFRSWSDYVKDEASAPALPAVRSRTATEAPAVADAEVAVASVERVAAPSNLFPRSGAEPLRAGHPDLWALLVAGTSLEGTEFSAV